MTGSFASGKEQVDTGGWGQEDGVFVRAILGHHQATLAPSSPSLHVGGRALSGLDCVSTGHSLPYQHHPALVWFPK